LTFEEACRFGNVKQVKFYISEGADVNSNCGYSLRIACFYGYLNIVKLLVKNGARISSLAIELANTEGHLNVVNYLNKQLLIKKINELIR
jgi:ankyrin repeat protein